MRPQFFISALSLDLKQKFRACDNGSKLSMRKATKGNKRVGVVVNTLRLVSWRYLSKIFGILMGLMWLPLHL